jgi:hypothetical protein
VEAPGEEGCRPEDGIGIPTGKTGERLRILRQPYAEHGGQYYEATGRDPLERIP